MDINSSSGIEQFYFFFNVSIKIYSYLHKFLISVFKNMSSESEETKLDDDNDQSHGEVDLPEKLAMFNFSSIPSFMLSLDIDSLYFGDEFLLKVVHGLGLKAIFSYNWMLDRRSSTNQSRFSVTTRNVDKNLVPLRLN